MNQAIKCFFLNRCEKSAHTGFRGDGIVNRRIYMI